MCSWTERLFHIWALPLKTISFIVYEPSGWWCKRYRHKQYINWITKACMTISGIIIQIYPLWLSSMILIMILACGVGEIGPTKWKDLWSEIHRKSPFQPRMPRKLLLPSHVWRGNSSFPATYAAETHPFQQRMPWKLFETLRLFWEDSGREA